MDLTETIHSWQENAHDPEIAAQLEKLIASGDTDAIQDAFYTTLEFGTAGLRGVLGPGTNRMNIYTVGQATQGLAAYLLKHAAGEQPSVAICYDSRINSTLFARTAACVLAQNGIKAYLYPRLEPTPACSFAVRYLHCDAGINITASHNPAEYNGYKAYGPDGCQIASAMADEISAAIDDIDIFSVKSADYDNACEQGLIESISDSVLDAFIDAVAEQGISRPEEATTPLRVVYTPLNGTGLECVSRILSRIGVDDVHVVESQEDPDGHFSTCPYPNPEIREAMEEGIKVCELVHPDLLLATDPDADRMGIAVKEDGDYVLLTGNEVGVLLFDYICASRIELHTMPVDPVMVSTIVSTDMADRVAEKYGVELRRVLTGFKWIGMQIGKLESEGHPERFIFGYEESYGYLAGTHVRDKDAVVASMLVCQMARHYRARGMNLVQAMHALYEEYGYYLNKTISATFEGMQGAAQMKEIMFGLRTNPPAQFAGRGVEQVVDYAQGIGELPTADVIELHLEGGQKIVFRPSGTEPKIKAYVFANAPTEDAAQEIRDQLTSAAQELFAQE